MSDKGFILRLSWHLKRSLEASTHLQPAQAFDTIFSCAFGWRDADQLKSSSRALLCQPELSDHQTLAFQEPLTQLWPAPKPDMNVYTVICPTQPHVAKKRMGVQNGDP